MDAEMKDATLIDPEGDKHSYDYDFVVIGGGSGGLSAVKEAAKLGAKTALLDYVNPSPQGTKWGLGGTCVNVGCIPKKLFHTAAILGDSLSDAAKYGWNSPEKKEHDWAKLSNAIADHIGSLNWGYRSQLRKSGVKYFNARGQFLDPHTLQLTNRANEKSSITARRFLLAVGGRPRLAKFPGAEYTITSDDIFWYTKPPGKTLVVGASYVALECAGFLAGLGYDVTVMVRSILLRGFDRAVAEKIGEYMANHGVKFIRPATIDKIEKEDEKNKVFWKKNDGTTGEDVYDTVMLAIGRTPETKYLQLDKAGVVCAEDGKIVGRNERTNVPHIYVLGDIYRDAETGKSLELTPVAIKAGLYLAQRLYAGSELTLNYDNVATTVFTPLEYGTIGLSEEEAIKKYGEDNLEIYHAFYQPLEWTVPYREDNACYVKVICNLQDEERVLGYHVLGPNAGEVTQGWAVGFVLGMRKSDIDKVIGIHPTISEEVTNLTTTKRSGKDPQKTGC